MSKTQRSTLSSLIRRIDTDTVEVKTRDFNILLRWIVWIILTIFLAISIYGTTYNAVVYDKWKPALIPANMIKENVDWICCIDKILYGQYKSHEEAMEDLRDNNIQIFSGVSKSFDEYKRTFSHRVTRAWGNLFFWALLFLPLLLPNPRAVRFDRRRGIIYTQNWRGQLFVAPIQSPVDTVSYPRLMGRASQFSPLIYLNSGFTNPHRPRPKPLASWYIYLYQRQSNGKLRAIYRDLGTFPPTPLEPLENEALFKAMEAFMQGNDSELTTLTMHYHPHPSWVGKLFGFSLLGRVRFKEKHLAKQLDKYQQDWQSLNNNERADYIHRIKTFVFSDVDDLRTIRLMAILVGPVLGLCAWLAYSH